jgi:X-Pro dipeptidyl-peptidase
MSRCPRFVLGHRPLAASFALPLLATLGTAQGTAPAVQDAKPTVPIFTDGQAQIVEGFKDPKQWIQHDLWVEADFDSDGDGDPDRLHVDVTRPKQTDTQGLKVAVVYESSPYFSGTGTTDSQYFWDPKQELGDKPPKRNPMPPVAFESKRPLMSSGLLNTWVPRGFAVVHSASPGTGLPKAATSAARTSRKRRRR